MYDSKEKSWSRGLVKSRLKDGRESRSRETEVGEKIAATIYDDLKRLLIQFRAQS